LQKNRGFPGPKGKEPKRPTPKAGPSKDATMEDSEEHLVEEISSSSDKGIWEVVKRKRPCPIRVDGSEESVEQESPPAKKLAMAEAVANALNKSFKIKEKKKEKKIDPLMEIVPLNPSK